MPSINSLANLRHSAQAAIAAASGQCPACTGIGRLHDCENFPLPKWTADYLAGFDTYLSGASVERDYRPRGEFLTDLCSDLADTLTALEPTC